MGYFSDLDIALGELAEGIELGRNVVRGPFVGPTLQILCTPGSIELGLEIPSRYGCRHLLFSPGGPTFVALA